MQYNVHKLLGTAAERLPGLMSLRDFCGAMGSSHYMSLFLQEAWCMLTLDNKINREDAAVWVGVAVCSGCSSMGRSCCLQWMQCMLARLAQACGRAPCSSGCAVCKGPRAYPLHMPHV